MRRSWLAVAMATTVAPWACAQMHVVKKPETVVRAVAVYEFTGPEKKPTASRVVPVSIFINNELQDAGVYLARPIPFSLNQGTIFEMQQTGVPEGTLEIAFVKHLVTTGDVQFEDGWLGYGLFKPKPSETYVASKQKGPLPKVLVNGSAAGGGNAGSSTASRVDRSGATSGKVSAAGTVGDDDDDSSEPVLVRKPVVANTDPATAKPDPATGSGTGSTSTVDPNDASDRPTLKRRSPDANPDSTSGADSSTPVVNSKGKPQKRPRGEQASVRGVGSLNDDPDRPTIHRGKPPGALDEDSLPPLNGLPADMEQRVLVSDAKDRPTHDFARSWESGAERSEVLAKMEEFARARLDQYDALTGLAKVAAAAAAPAKPAAKTTSAKTAAARKKVASAAAAPPALLVLNDEELKGYTLSYGGAATFVYTATSPVATAAGAKVATEYVTIVAQREAGDAIKLALTSVTDSAHLDRTPWMRLIDVVDAEASNRASLLFELRGQSSRQFALYRVIGAEAEESLVTGTNP